MKFQKLLVIAVSVCMLAVFLPGSKHAQAGEEEIIDGFCEDIVEISAEAAEDLAETKAQMAECYKKYNECLEGDFLRDPGECSLDYRKCLRKWQREQKDVCADFLNDFKQASREARQQAQREGLGDEFIQGFAEEYQECTNDACADTQCEEECSQCLDPFIDVGRACAQLDDDGEDN